MCGRYCLLQFVCWSTTNFQLHPQLNGVQHTSSQLLQLLQKTDGISCQQALHGHLLFKLVDQFLNGQLHAFAQPIAIGCLAGQKACLSPLWK